MYIENKEGDFRLVTCANERMFHINNVVHSYAIDQKGGKV